MLARSKRKKTADFAGQGGAKLFILSVILALVQPVGCLFGFAGSKLTPNLWSCGNTLPFTSVLWSLQNFLFPHLQSESLLWISFPGTSICHRWPLAEAFSSLAEPSVHLWHRHVKPFTGWGHHQAGDSSWEGFLSKAVPLRQIAHEAQAVAGAGNQRCSCSGLWMLSWQLGPCLPFLRLVGADFSWKQCSFAPVGCEFPLGSA